MVKTDEMIFNIDTKQYVDCYLKIDNPFIINAISDALKKTEPPTLEQIAKYHKYIPKQFVLTNIDIKTISTLVGIFEYYYDLHTIPKGADGTKVNWV